jgi:hypothetical protein
MRPFVLGSVMSGMLVAAGFVQQDAGKKEPEMVEGFVSKHKFKTTDIDKRLKAIDWFSCCGKPLKLDLTMEFEQVNTWPEAINLCKTVTWENVEIEAQNQLSLWLHRNERKNY